MVKLYMVFPCLILSFISLANLIISLPISVSASLDNFNVYALIMKRYSFQTVLVAQSYGKGLEFWVLNEANCSKPLFFLYATCKYGTDFIFLFTIKFKGMPINKISVGLFLSFSLLSVIPVYSLHDKSQQETICDEVNHILSGMKDNFNALKGNLIVSTNNYWHSTLTLSNTKSNFIYTQFNYKGEPLYHEYYAIIAESGTADENNVVIEKMAQFMAPCALTGFTKKAAGGLGQFSDDPEFEKSLPKSYTWVNNSDRSTIDLKSFYDTATKKYRVAAIFKTPNNASVLPVKSAPGTTASKLTVINRSNEEIEGYWLDFEGKEVYYFNLKSNEQVMMDSYIGHVWRFKSATSKTNLKTILVENSNQILDFK